MPFGPTTSSTSTSSSSCSTPSPTSTDSASSPSFAAPTSSPNASCTRSGSTASSSIASATGTLHFTAVPPSILPDRPPRSHQERTGRRDRRHLKVLRAPGQPRSASNAGASDGRDEADEMDEQRVRWRARRQGSREARTEQQSDPHPRRVREAGSRSSRSRAKLLSLRTICGTELRPGDEASRIATRGAAGAGRVLARLRLARLALWTTSDAVLRASAWRF